MKFFLLFLVHLSLFCGSAFAAVGSIPATSQSVYHFSWVPYNGVGYAYTDTAGLQDDCNHKAVDCCQLTGSYSNEVCHFSDARNFPIGNYGSAYICPSGFVLNGAMCDPLADPCAGMTGQTVDILSSADSSTFCMDSCQVLATSLVCISGPIQCGGTGRFTGLSCTGADIAGVVPPVSAQTSLDAAAQSIAEAAQSAATAAQAAAQQAAYAHDPNAQALAAAAVAAQAYADQVAGSKAGLVAPQSPNPTDYSRESTQGQIKTGIDVLHQDLDSSAFALPPGEPMSPGALSLYENKKITDLLDDSVGSYNNFKLLDWSTWIPVFPSASCSPFSGNVMGKTITWDLCPKIAMLNELIGWLLSIFAAWSVVGLMFRSRSA